MGSFQIYLFQSCISLLVSASLITGCSRKINYDSSAFNVKGTVMLGLVKQAKVIAYPVKEDGTPDLNHPLQSTYTQSNGTYSFHLKATSTPVVIQATGGTYTEAASGDTISLQKNSLSTILPSVSGTQSIANVAITTLTEIAYQRYLKLAATPLTVAQLSKVATNANYAVSQAFGINDIVGTLPDDPNEDISAKQSGTYTLVLLGLSSLARTNLTDSFAITSAFAKSFSPTGVFSSETISTTDSNGNSIDITLPTLISLTNTIQEICDGTLELKEVAQPVTYTIPIMTSTPPSTAPDDYVVGNSSL